MSFKHINDAAGGNRINVDGFRMSADFFETQEPGYSLPENAISRIYVPGKRHHLKIMRNGVPTSIQGPDTVDHVWPEGDAYIAKKQDYIDAWEEANKPDIEEIAAAQIAALNIEAAAVMTGGIESDALGTTHRYDSTLTDQTNLNTAVGLNVDTNFQCDDLQGNAGSKVSRLHTAAQLKQVQLDAATFVQTQLATVRALKADVLAIVADDATYPDYDSKKAAIEAIEFS